MTLISSIKIGDRHRKDMGDLHSLADSIVAQGLLQPIGITTENELVFGERRLRACRDILGWTQIETRVVNVTSIVEGEQEENEIRKDFTPSERVAIAAAVAEKMGKRQGQRTDLQHTDNCPEVSGETRDIVAEKSGFSSGKQYERAKAVVEEGIPELVEKMDAGEVSVSAAAIIAKQDKEVQQRIVAEPDMKKAVSDLRESVKQAATIGIRGGPAPSNKNPLYKPPSKAGSAWSYLYGECRALNEWATEENVALALDGMSERTDDQSANISAVRKSAEALTRFLEKIDAE